MQFYIHMLWIKFMVRVWNIWTSVLFTCNDDKFPVLVAKQVKCLPCDHYKLRVMILNWKRHTSWNCAECCHRLLRVFPWIIAAVFPLAISCKANWILTYLYSSFIVRITSSRVLHVNKLRSILINHVIFSHLSHLLW